MMDHHSRKSSGDSSPQGQQHLVDATQRPHNRLSLKNQFSRIRWSSLGRSSSPEQEKVRNWSPNKASKTSHPVPKHLKIGEPVLCSASMDGQLDDSVVKESFNTTHLPPKPPVSSSSTADEPSDVTTGSQGPDSVSGSLTTGVLTPEMTASPALLSMLNIDADLPHRESRCSCATLEDLPSRFDEIRSRAYEVSPSSVPEVERTDETTDGGASSTGFTDEQNHSQEGTDYEFEKLEDHEVLFDSPMSDEILIRSGSSTRSTAATCMSQEFYFDDPPPMKSRQTLQPSRIISTWRPEQLVSRATSSPLPLEPRTSSLEDPSFYSAPNGTNSHASLFLISKESKDSKTTSQTSLGLGLPLPPTKATQLPRTANDASLEDLTILLSSLDSSVGTHSGQPLISSALASEPAPNSELNTSKIYKEAISRLNEVRQIEVQMLADRIKMLEAREPQYSDIADEPLELFNKVQGLPRFLPIKPSSG